MKNLTILLLFCFSEIFGQDKFDEYKAFDGKMYNLEISTNSDKFTLWINSYSSDKLFPQGGFKVTEKRYPEFVEAIRLAKNKYIEWRDVAQKNKVVSLAKEMNITCTIDAYFKYGNEWQFHKNIKPTFRIVIYEHEDQVYYSLGISSGELTSSTNEFMHNDGVNIVFNNTDEVDSFLNKISPDKLKNALLLENKKNLFKE